MAFEATRIKKLNRAPVVRGAFVLYWMQQSQRAEDNHALEYAIEEANRLDQAVIVIFCLMPDYPDAVSRHYAFMLEGLKETRDSLAGRGIGMTLRIGDPVRLVLELGRRASMIVCDRGYLRHQVSWRRTLSEKAGCSVVQVETDVTVPVAQVSGKVEYAAYTIRPKIHRQLDHYLKPVFHETPIHTSIDADLETHSLENIPSLLELLKVDGQIPPVPGFFRGGTTEAKKRFGLFLKERFPAYVENRNKPGKWDVSCMGPYLHFGQISPLYLALKVRALENQYPEAAAAYLEELIVRRELAVNFVCYHPAYDTLDSLPAWAEKSLAEHAKDSREYDYSMETLIACSTHDPYWNAAMREMVVTGYLHNYMRMYWGKKILEWSRTPEAAYDKLITLNNAYLLDGRDPNSYAGAGWIFGLHDRAWFERPVFGKVRYMAASGLERKCSIKDYVRKVDQMSDPGLF